MRLPLTPIAGKRLFERRLQSLQQTAYFVFIEKDVSMC
jgi:hypothetical protein